MEKIWNVDHFDYYETRESGIKVIVKCECNLTDAEQLEESEIPHWVDSLTKPFDILKELESVE